MAGRKAAAYHLIGAAVGLLGASSAGAVASLPGANSPAKSVSTPAPAGTPAPAAAGRRAVHLSPAGLATAKKWLGTPDPEVRALFGQRAGINSQIAAAAGASPIDLGRVGTLMQQAAAIESKIRDRQNVIVMSMLKELSEPDRVSYLRAVTAVPVPPPVAPPAPAKPKAG